MMSEISFWRDEIIEQRMPGLCMRCGRPADDIVYHKFGHARRARGFIGNVLTTTFARRELIPIPLCSRHKNSWRKLNWASAVLILVPVASISIALALGPGKLLGILTVVFALSLLLGLVLITTWRNFVVHVREMNDDEVTLGGVSERFVSEFCRKKELEDSGLPYTEPSAPVRESQAIPFERWAVLCMIVGILLFSVPLFALAVHEIAIFSRWSMFGGTLSFLAAGAFVVASKWRGDSNDECE